MIKILNINRETKYSWAFNSKTWYSKLREIGIESNLVSLQFEEENLSNYAFVKRSLSFRRLLQKQIEKIEWLVGFDGNLHYSYNSLKNNILYKESDIIHMHLIDGYFSIYDLKKISRTKKILFSVHDFWLLTGHCAYPTGCNRFKKGCGECPDLLRYPQLRIDRTKILKKRKLKLLKSKNVFIHVATKKLKEVIMDMDPTLINKTFVLGLPNAFKDNYTKKIKDPTKLKIGIRFTNQFQKNMGFNRRLLFLLKDIEGIEIHCIDDISMAHEFCQNLNKVIYKNEGKDDLYIFYSNIDILVNPTIDETYGLMSIEAASFGVPTITVSESPILSIMGIENVYVTNNPREAVNVIEDINKNRKNFEIMSDQVLRRSKVFLSPDEFAIEISKVYFRILEK